MEYKLHISQDSTKIERLIIIFPGMDDLTEPGSQQPLTSNNINMYDLFGSITANMSRAGTVVIVPEYSAPHQWGSPVNFNILTDQILQTLQTAVNELSSNGLTVDIKNIDLGAHSYGFTPLFWSLANDVFGKIPGISSKYDINLHLLEPYGIAVMRNETNSCAFREEEVVAAARQRFIDIASGTNMVSAIQNELKILKSFDFVKNINIMFGVFKPLASIHDSYNSLNIQDIYVNLINLDKNSYGGGLLEILKAQLEKTIAPEHALNTFQVLLNVWIYSLLGIRANDESADKQYNKEQIKNKIDELCIKAGIMRDDDVQVKNVLKAKLYN